MKKIYKNDGYEIAIIEEDNFLSVLKDGEEKKLRLCYKGGVNVFLEILSALEYADKNWDDISSLALKLERDLESGLKLTGRVLYSVSEIPTRVSTPLWEIIETIAGWSYDDGYGIQELEGVIVFNDGSWLQRVEYDGSEAWEYFKTPSVEDVVNIIDD